MSSATQFRDLNRVALTKIIGYEQSARPVEKNGRKEPFTRLSLTLQTYVDKSRYSGAALRALRKERGVGRPPQKR